MSSLPSVALAGATGNLGEPMLKALLEAGLQVTILTRQGSKSTSSLPSHPNQTVKEVDYSSVDSLADALGGVKVVVTTLGSTSLDSQHILIDAAIKAGVSRFIPSEFGSETPNPLNSALPVFGDKIAVQAYLKEKSTANPDFTYTLFINSAFLDWGLQVGFLANPKEHTATLYDGGDRPFSTTRLSTIGKGIVGVIENLDTTANETVYVHDGVTTQNKLIAATKEVDGGKEWETTVKSTKEVESESYAEMKKEGGNIGQAMIGFILVSIFQDGHGADFTGKTWNEKLGLSVLSQTEFDQVVKDVVKGL